MALDENGVSEIEWERLYNPDNSIFLSGRKLMSEVNAIIFLLICTNIFFVIRFFFQHYVLKPIALSFNMRKSYTARFLENGWYTLYYISFFLIGSYVYSQENWSIFPTMNIWLGWPTQPFSTLFRTYYLIELSFYVHCTIALFFETRRKDFNQMLTHHVATFFLVGCSYWYRYHRIGIAILWIHNIADIFLYSAKALNYISKEIKNKTVQIVCDGLFVMFAVSFFVTRLIFFPFTLIKSSLTEAYYVSVEFPLFYPTNVALLTLLILHMFWFFLIARIIYIKLFKSKDFDDIRSDSDEDEPEVKPTQKGLEAEPIRTKKNNNKLTQTNVSKATQKKEN